MNTLRSSRAILLAVGLLTLVLAFSAFSFAPSAHAAPVQQPAHAAAVQPQRGGASCGLIIQRKLGRIFDVNLWRNTCNGTVFAQLVAHQSHIYRLTIWGNRTCSGFPLQTVRRHLLRGQSLSTHVFHVRSACAKGKVVG